MYTVSLPGGETVNMVGKTVNMVGKTVDLVGIGEQFNSWSIRYRLLHTGKLECLYHMCLAVILPYEYRFAEVPKKIRLSPAVCFQIHQSWDCPFKPSSEVPMLRT